MSSDNTGVSIEHQFGFVGCSLAYQALKSKSSLCELTLSGLPAGFSRIYERESRFFPVLSEPNLVVGLCPENPRFGTFSLCLASFL